MTRTMYDSTDPNAIPCDSDLVAGYVDMRYAWTDEQWAMFPGKTLVRIAVNPATNDGHVLDIEPGNWDAEASVDWVIMRRAAGLEPTVYCGNWQAGFKLQDVLDAHSERGIDPPQIWLADWNGQADVPEGTVAHQYLATRRGGLGFDVSAVADYWPGVDPSPA